jgi:hypothetical protein
MYEDYAYDIMERYLETTLFALIVDLKSNEQTKPKELFYIHNPIIRCQEKRR